MVKKQKLAVVIASLFSVSNLLADEGDLNKFRLGLGVISIGAEYKDDAGQGGLILYPQYKGDRFNLDYNEISYKLVKSPVYSLAVMGAPRFQGFDSDDDDLFEGMSDRDSAFELGLNLSFYSGYGNLSFKGLGDVSDAHDGYELSITYDYPLKLNNWTFDFKLGSRYQSDNLVDYYYGVEDSEVSPKRSAYQGDSAQIFFTGIDTSYQITQRWKAVMNLNFDRLPNEIENSPLVDEDGDVNIIVSGFLGVNYQF